MALTVESVAIYLKSFCLQVLLLTK